MADEQEETADAQAKPRQQRKPRPDKGRQKSAVARPDEIDPYELGRWAFQACGRCSYFLADCELLVGEDALVQAFEAPQEGWLVIACDDDMRAPLATAFGERIELDTVYFNGVCPECRRRYTFRAGESPDDAAELRLQYPT